MLHQHAAGSYPLQRPHVNPQGSGTQVNSALPLSSEDREQPGSDEQAPPPPLQTEPAVHHHEFKVRVEGVRDLEVASTTVWGEADCYIQYHFPTLPEDAEGNTGECCVWDPRSLLELS